MQVKPLRLFLGHIVLPAVWISCGKTVHCSQVCVTEQLMCARYHRTGSVLEYNISYYTKCHKQ